MDAADEETATIAKKVAEEAALAKKAADEEAVEFAKKAADEVAIVKKAADEEVAAIAKKAAEEAALVKKAAELKNQRVLIRGILNRLGITNGDPATAHAQDAADLNDACERLHELECELEHASRMLQLSNYNA